MRLGGYGADEARGRSPVDLLLPAPGTEVCSRLRLRQALREREPFPAERLRYGKDQAAYWTVLDGKALPATAAAPGGYVRLALDLSDRRHAEQLAAVATWRRAAATESGGIGRFKLDQKRRTAALARIAPRDVPAGADPD